MGTVLAFSGKIATGKSFLSHRVADALGWPVVSFGDYVRKLARQRGLDDKLVPVLQDLGKDQVDRHLTEFCSAVLAEAPGWRPGASLVVDGLRHAEVKRELTSLVAPSELLTVHIQADRATREARMVEKVRAGRAKGSVGLDVLDAHPTEAQVSAVLPRMADFVVDGTEDEASLVAKVLDWLKPASDAPLMGLFELADRHPDDPDMPADGAARHDHYLYGRAKKP